MAIGGIAHETNTYAVESFGLTRSEAFEVARRDRLLN